MPEVEWGAHPPPHPPLPPEAQNGAGGLRERHQRLRLVETRRMTVERAQTDHLGKSYGPAKSGPGKVIPLQGPSVADDSGSCGSDSDFGAKRPEFEPLNFSSPSSGH